MRCFWLPWNTFLGISRLSSKGFPSMLRFIRNIQVLTTSTNPRSPPEVLGPLLFCVGATTAAELRAKLCMAQNDVILQTAIGTLHAYHRKLQKLGSILSISPAISSSRRASFQASPAHCATWPLLKFSLGC